MIGDELKTFVLVPKQGGSVCREVKSGVLYTSEEDEEKAVDTIWHELVDLQIAHRIVRPLVDLLR